METSLQELLKKILIIVPDSSMLDGIGYRNRVLYAEFNDGELYQYSNVPRKNYELLLNAIKLRELGLNISIGKLFNQIIKNHPEYKCRYINK